MEKELAKKANSKCSIGQDWKDGINKSNSAHKTGSKFQTTVRFQSKTFHNLQKAQEHLDASFAETVRRVTREGLYQIKEKQNLVLSILDNLQSQTVEKEVEEAVKLTKKEIERSQILED